MQWQAQTAMRSSASASVPDGLPAAAILSPAPLKFNVTEITVLTTNDEATASNLGLSASTTYLYRVRMVKEGVKERLVCSREWHD